MSKPLGDEVAATRAEQAPAEDGPAEASHRPPARPVDAALGAATTGLVSPSWVADHLDRPDLVLVEVDEEAATHHWSHLPGATFVDWQDCRRELLAPGPAGTAAFERLMSARGIRPDDDVVLYGDVANRYACAVLWLMRHHGHRSLRIMDGGRAAWLAQGLPMSERESARTPSDYRAGDADPSIRIGRDDLLQHLAEPPADAVLVDCRTPEEFAGHAPGPAHDLTDPFLERGHLPDAINLPASALLGPEGDLLPVDELRRVRSEHGLHEGQSITAYCHTSDRSCLVWFALHEVLGHRSVQVYDGGWQEYGHLLGVPVAGPRDVEHDESAPVGGPVAVASSPTGDGAPDGGQRRDSSRTGH